VEIQALWHNALLVGESLAHLNQDPNSATRWREAADKLQGNFLTRFWDEQRHTLFDRLTAAGEPDTRVRPNVLMVLSVPQIAPLLSPTQAAQVVNHTVSELLFPHGIASLSPRDPDFHPYHHLEESYHFDAAYHNGTVWGWNAGFTITALCQTGQEELAYALTQNLTRQILDLGCRGGMSELVEAIPRPGEPITLSGTWAQAWSSSEFARNATQDFLGFQPRLLEQILVLSPRLPRAWTSVQARLPFGTESLEVDILQKEQFELKVKRQGGHEPAFTLSLNLWVKERSYVLTCPLPPAGEVNLAITGRTLSLNGEPMGEGIEAPHPPACSFVVPALPSPCPVLEGKDVLQRKIEAEL
jgi:glycogen debranching enzyme